MKNRRLKGENINKERSIRKRRKRKRNDDKTNK